MHRSVYFLQSIDRAVPSLFTNVVLQFTDGVDVQGGLGSRDCDGRFGRGRLLSHCQRLLPCSCQIGGQWHCSGQVNDHF